MFLIAFVETFFHPSKLSIDKSGSTSRYVPTSMRKEKSRGQELYIPKSKTENPK